MLFNKIRSVWFSQLKSVEYFNILNREFNRANKTKELKKTQ